MLCGVQRIPLLLVLSGLVGTVGRAVKFWLHYTLVAVAWLGVVPLTACRIYRTLFTGSVSTILSLPINVFSTDNILTDILQVLPGGSQSEGPFRGPWLVWVSYCLDWGCCRAARW